MHTQTGLTDMIVSADRLLTDAICCEPERFRRPVSSLTLLLHPQVHMKDVMSALWVSGLDSSYLREQMLNEPLVREIVKECSNIPLSQPQQGEAMLASFKPRGYSECIVTIGGEERV